MKQTPLSYWEAAKIGLLLSASIACLCLIFWPESRSMTILSINATLVVILTGIMGALAGQLLLKTHRGAWLGAGVTLVLLFWWLYSIASNMRLE